jgi:phosphoribosylformylglycinamidine cyclo-ligase
MLGGFDGEPQAPVTGVIHVTGGGIPEKAKRALRPAGLGAVLDNLFEPPQIMREVQELGNVALDKAYNTWNMGNGMLVITPKPFEVIEVARRHGLEAKIAGEVRPEEGIRIKTYTGKWLN